MADSRSSNQVWKLAAVGGLAGAAMLAAYHLRKDKKGRAKAKPPAPVPTVKRTLLCTSSTGEFTTFDFGSVKHVVRPDAEGLAKVRVCENRRLTPDDYDRNIFHIGFDVKGTELETYDPGDCIGVFPQNPPKVVEKLLSGCGFDGNQLMDAGPLLGADGGLYLVTLRDICTEYLDLNGQPDKGFYLALSKFTKDIVDKVYLAELSLSRLDDVYKSRKDLAVTYASTILEFPTVKITPEALLDLVPLTRPRLYSIASSARKHPGEVHLCIVTEDWQNSKGDTCYGLSSNYTESLKLTGTETLYSICNLVRSDTLKPPKSPETPMIMAGLGTGLAPFRAFSEHRNVDYEEGKKVGNARLYYGGRHQKGEFLYREEIEKYVSQGWLAFRAAWSRDQKHKIYIQMLLEQDAEEVWEILNPKTGGHFYMCGPIAPLKDIRAALEKIFVKYGAPGGAAYFEELESTGRFQSEVY